MKYIKFTIILLFVLLPACNEKAGIDLGKGYRFDNDPVISNDYAIFGPYENIYAVSGHVLKYNFDSLFIIAEQKPRDIILNAIGSSTEMTYKEQEKLFSESHIRQYWIIKKTNDSIWGPLTKEEYLHKREELKIPKELELKEK